MKKKIIFILTALCLFMQMKTIHVYAGGINGNEASVIGVASGGFEYNGVTYVAKSTYVAQLTAKLSEDGVDLTAEQASAAISEIYANIENGIESGYLEVVSPATEPKEPEKPTESEPTDNTDKTEATEPKKDKKPTEPTDKASEINETAEPTAQDREEADIVEEEGKVQAVSDNGEIIYSSDTIIKDTGYNIASLLYTGITVVIATVLCIIYMLRGRMEQSKNE